MYTVQVECRDHFGFQCLLQAAAESQKTKEEAKRRQQEKQVQDMY